MPPRGAPPSSPVGWPGNPARSRDPGRPPALAPLPLKRPPAPRKPCFGPLGVLVLGKVKALNQGHRHSCPQGPGVATDDVAGRSEVCANSREDPLKTVIRGEGQTLLVTATPAAPFSASASGFASPQGQRRAPGGAGGVSGLSRLGLQPFRVHSRSVPFAGLQMPRRWGHGAGGSGTSWRQQEPQQMAGPRAHVTAPAHCFCQITSTNLTLFSK